MGVPKEIREVPRPRNTVVVDNGHDGIYRYAVLSRLKSVYTPGKNPSPRNGPVIGHIINGEYIPSKREEKNIKPDCLSFGAISFFKSVTEDIKELLLKTFDASIAYFIITVAALRVIRQGITISRLARAYETSFASIYYPNVSLSKNTATEYFTKIGMNTEGRDIFFGFLISNINENHKLVIDGTLKTDTSKVNDVSKISRSTYKTGTKNVSVIFLRDVETGEPLCSKLYPGNNPDASAYLDFIKGNNITKGIIISDKGFPPSKIKETIDKNSDLHFFTPIKINDKRIESYNLLDFEGTIKGIDEAVLYKKVKTKENKFLYCFKNLSISSTEERNFINKLNTSKDKDRTFSNEVFNKKRSRSGVIVFESDLDIDPKDAYLYYKDRWFIEVMFKSYKNDLKLKKTSVQNDFTVIGSEFVNFVSILASCRMVNKAIKLNLLDNRSFGNLIEDLNSAWRKINSPDQPKRNDSYWVHTLVSVHKDLEKLSLSVAPPQPAQRKRGRPPKNKNREETSSKKTQEAKDSSSTNNEINSPLTHDDVKKFQNSTDKETNLQEIPQGNSNTNNKTTEINLNDFVRKSDLQEISIDFNRQFESFKRDIISIITNNNTTSQS